MMMRSANIQVGWFGLGVIVSILGCSPSGPPPRGIVRFDDGQLVQSGTVEFRSLDSGQRFVGKISSDGTFELEDQAGAAAFPPGDYEVVIVQIVLTEDLAAENHQHGRTVPRQYADYYTSNLRIFNAADRTGPIVVELSSSP